MMYENIDRQMEDCLEEIFLYKNNKKSKRRKGNKLIIY